MLLGLLAALAGVATVAPGAVAVAFVVLAVLARTIDRSVAGLWRRRTERGRRPSDAAVTVLALPWRLLTASLASLLAAVLPALVALAAAFITASSVAGGRPALPSGGPALAVGAVAGAWWRGGGRAGDHCGEGAGRGCAHSCPPAGVAVVLALLLVAGGMGAASCAPAGGPRTRRPSGSCSCRGGWACTQGRPQTSTGSGRPNR